MLVLPLLLSCTTLNHESSSDREESAEKNVSASTPANEEQAKKIVAPPTPASSNYGKLRKSVRSVDILFDFDSANLKPNGIQFLDYLAEELQNQNDRIVVTGHTDRIGSEAYNIELSLRRAESVKIQLIAKGIDPDRILTEGKGEESPVTGNSCKDNIKREALIECLSPDRRVEIDIVNK